MTVSDATIGKAAFALLIAAACTSLCTVGASTTAAADAKEAAAATAAFDAQADSVGKLADRLNTPCLQALKIAAQDKGVRKLFLEKWANPHYVFKGVRCFGSGIPEYKRLLFDFDCRPDIICLIDPQFLVVVDFVSGRVVRIIDPYVGVSVDETRKAAARSTISFEVHAERDGNGVRVNAEVCASIAGIEKCVTVFDATVRVADERVEFEVERGRFTFKGWVEWRSGQNQVKVYAEACYDPPIGGDICVDGSATASVD